MHISKRYEKGVIMQNRRFIFISGICLTLFALSGCSSESEAESVEMISDWSFQFNEGTNDYSLFFGLSDSNNVAVSADANVDIKIINSADEVVYDQTKTITPDDFNYYTSEARGDVFLADVRIPKDEVKEGKALDGTVYFKVYNEQAFEFDEYNYPVFYELPIQDFSVISETLPKEINVYDFEGSILSTLLIENMEVEIDDDMSPEAIITVTGAKIYEDSSMCVEMDSFDYQLCDSEGYAINSGTVFLNGLRSGDKFKDDSIVFYDLVPGEQYTLKFESPVW